MSDLRDKLALMEIAATLTAGVIANLPNTMPDDPDAPETQKENATEWKLFRTFYGWLAADLANDADFPAAPAGIAGGGGGSGGSPTAARTPAVVATELEGVASDPASATRVMAAVQKMMSGTTTPPAGPRGVLPPS